MLIFFRPKLEPVLLATHWNIQKKKGKWTAQCYLYFEFLILFTQQPW